MTGIVPKVQRCYYCNEELSEQETVIKEFPLACKNGKVRNYKRKFHYECLPKYIDKNGNVEEKERESSEWEEVYEYFKFHILGLPATATLDNYSVKRLLGLRVGKFMPNATNTRVVKTGYSYPTILNTMKYVKRQVENGFKMNSFNNEEHRINYAMSIISKNVNFIQRRMEVADKQSKQLDKIKYEYKERPRYVKKGGRKKFAFLDDDL